MGKPGRCGAERLCFERPRDFHLVGFRVGRELRGRKWGEPNVRPPWLTSGSTHDEVTRLLGEKAPTHAQGLGQQPLGSPRGGRCGPHELLPEPEDDADEAQGLEIEGAGNVQHECGGGVDCCGEPLPNVRVRNKVIKW